MNEREEQKTKRKFIGKVTEEQKTKRKFIGKVRPTRLSGLVKAVRYY